MHALRQSIKGTQSPAGDETKSPPSGGLFSHVGQFLRYA
jgi:hypothetical protein